MRITFSIINDYVGDQRIQRIAGYLHEIGHEVEIVCRILPDSLPVNHFPYKVKRLHLFFTKGKFFYLEFTIRLFFYLLFQKTAILVANDLDTLLPNFLISRLKKQKLIYDSHEYFTQVPELIHRPATQKVWLKIEQFIFPKLKWAYTVNGSIASIYEKLYQVPVKVIRNLPTRKVSSSPALSPPYLLLYQGALNVGRGIDLMIDAMRFLPDYELLIIGKGDVEKALRERAKDQKNIRFQGFIPPASLHTLTQNAKLGFSLEEDLGGNYHYASPNKLYDYIQAYIPCIASDLPEIRNLVETFGTGEILPFAERNAENLAKKVRHICENPKKYAQFQENCAQAASILCWENEREKLQEFYPL